METPTTEPSEAPSAAAYPCPSLKTDGSRDATILYTYTWINDGCPTPIRRGFYARDGFGWDHIEYRRIVDGQINHQTTAYARYLWAQALATPGASGPPLTCHQKKYTTPGGTKRTMVVVHSHTNYKGSLGRKGIITAYWKSGHVNGCTSPSGG